MNPLEKIFHEWRKAADHPLDPERLEALRGQIVLVKYGGNAMVSDSPDDPVLDQVAVLAGAGVRPVIVHGGGPVILQLLEDVGIESVFVAGHRRTDEKAMRYVEMALRGQVNGRVVKRLNARGGAAVGLSGKDASMVRVKRRIHRHEENGETVEVDLGYVGDIVSIQPDLIHTLLDHGYVPVVAPVATGPDGMDYNVNADMFAGHLAGALEADTYVAVTDVDGLMDDPQTPASRLRQVTAKEIREKMGVTIQGGMIPKVESCLIALENGVRQALILNGMKPGRLLQDLFTKKQSGTIIKRDH